MYIVVFMKGSPNCGPYVAVDGNNKAKEFAALPEAQKFVENHVTTNKVTTYDVVILDQDKHEVANWAAALPPALQWNKAVTVEPEK
jgi:hypothetical protein